MNWKRFSLLLALVFLISIISSLTTRYVMSRHQEKQTSWKEMLSLTPDQEKMFSALESEFNIALKGIELQDAQNKIALCSYLRSENRTPEAMKASSKKMADAYQVKQNKIAMTLASITEILTPEQKQLFTDRLMHEVCVSCKKATGTEKCICGMCDHHT